MADSNKRKAANGTHKGSEANKRTKQTKGESPPDPFWDKSLFMAVEKVSFQCYDPDLDNPIGPIWRQENFQKDKDFDYEIVETSARLATRFWHELVKMSDSPLDKVVNSSHNTRKVDAICSANQAPHFAYEEPTGTPQERKQNLDEAVARLAELVSFQPNARVQEDGQTECLPRKDFPRSQRLQPDECRSRVSFSRKAYNDLSALTKNRNDLVKLMIAQWKFAVLLVHEAAHALQYSRNGAKGNSFCNSIFLHTDPMKAPLAEIGFDAEVALFGGLIELRFGYAGDDEPVKRYRYTDGEQTDELSGLAGVMVQWRWPSKAVWEHYHEGKLPAGCREEHVWPEKDIACRLPLSYFARQYQTTFWDDDVKKHGVEALRPVQKVGFRFGHDTTDAYLTRDDVAVPIGFRLNESCDLVPREG